MKTAIIIPARMASKRFPNKPLALINGIPMIQRVWEKAIAYESAETFVACCEQEVFDLINQLGGNAIMTNPNLPSGTDRIYQALLKIKNFRSFESIINLQGDMPLINSEDIIKVNEPLKSGFNIGSLATNLSKIEEKNQNITKVEVEWMTNEELGIAKNFYKTSKELYNNIYHHVGIYSYTFESLEQFISNPPSINEIKFNLEQFRALDAGLTIGMYYVENIPLSVDTKEDLIHLENIINKQND